MPQQPSPELWAEQGPRRWPEVLFALRADTRFQYFMHVPDAFQQSPGDYSLVVVLHGTGRGAQSARDNWATLADEHRWVLLLPVFPAGVLGDGNTDGYKYLKEGDIRYDHLLLEMVDELSIILKRPFERFFLAGFSGGGHFVHRFFYLHPRRLAAVSVGAPGGVTRIDPTRDFWLGTRDLLERFGTELDLEAARAVPVQLIVGELDTEEFVYPPQWAAALADMGDIGKNRIERNAALHRNYLEHGLAAERVIVPNAAHCGAKMVPEQAAFFARVYRSRAT